MTLRLDDFRQQQKPHTAPPPAKDTHTHTHRDKGKNRYIHKAHKAHRHT